MAIKPEEQPSGAALDGPEHLQIQARSQLDELLMEGLESGEAIEVTDDWWKAKRTSLLQILPALHDLDHNDRIIVKGAIAGPCVFDAS